MCIRDSPHVVRIYGATDDDRYILNEYAPLGSLTNYDGSPSVLSRRCPPYAHYPSAKLLAAAALQVAEAAAAFYDAGLLHRDLAARNVLAFAFDDRDVLVKLTDFGLVADRRLTVGGASTLLTAPYKYGWPEKHAMGTRWMAPEAMPDGDFAFDDKTEIYGLGVVLWELFSLGAVPYGDLRNDAIPAAKRSGAAPDVGEPSGPDTPADVGPGAHVVVGEYAVDGMLPLLFKQFEEHRWQTKLGAVKTLLLTMRQHIKRTDVNEHACGVLRCVCEASDGCRKLVIDAHGVPMLAAVIKRHSLEAIMQRDGVMALGALVLTILPGEVHAGTPSGVKRPLHDRPEVSVQILEEMLAAELGAVFIPCGLGHLIGLDTHDVGGYLKGCPPRIESRGISKLRTARVLAEHA